MIVGTGAAIDLVCFEAVYVDAVDTGGWPIQIVLFVRCWVAAFTDPIANAAVKTAIVDVHIEVIIAVGQQVEQRKAQEQLVLRNEDSVLSDAVGEPDKGLIGIIVDEAIEY